MAGASNERKPTFSSGTPLNITRLGISATETAATAVPTETQPVDKNTAKFNIILWIRILIA